MKTLKEAKAFIGKFLECNIESNHNELLEAFNFNISMFRSKKYEQFISPYPSDYWSFFNRLMVNLLNNRKEGRTRAAGFKQWNKIFNRYIIKNEKARAFIYVPIFKKKEDEEGNIKEDLFFISKPVWYDWQTQGQELPKPSEVQLNLSFKRIIENLNIKVSSDYLINAYGSFNKYNNTITLGSSEKSVFYHELGHSIHNSFEELENGQVASQEVIAEITAMVLNYYLDGVIYKENLDYINRYKKELDLQKESLHIINTINKIIDYIALNIEAVN